MQQTLFPLVEKIDDQKIQLSPAPWVMHEFFAGSGLVAYGLKGMFTPLWSNDICSRKARVYEANFNSKHFHLGDVKTVRGHDLPYAHLSWASFPCQDLSLAGAGGGIDARRSGLVWEWLRILDEMSERPPILLVENVAGLLSAGRGDYYRKLHGALIERGYDCGAIMVDASLFVPQSRPRVFIIAIERGWPIPKDLVREGPCWLHTKGASELGRNLPRWIWWYTEEPPRRFTRLEDILEPHIPFDKNDVLDLIPQRHKMKLDDQSTVYATGYRRTRQGQQQLELRFDGIAGCLRTPEGGSSKQFLIVKKDGETHARLLTVREVARLMGVPDTFHLPGSANDGYKAMGDAVALPVARFIGERFLMKLAEAFHNGRN